MQKLLLILLCLPLLFSSCKKTEGCVEGDCKEGYGTFIDKYRGTYVGDFKNGKYHGEGAFTYLSSETLEEESGNWKNGELDGYGTRIWSKNSNDIQQTRYEGDFENGRINGSGTKWYVWGDYFVGDFTSYSNGDGTQTGTMYSINGTSEYGTWETTLTYKRN
jgi:hypothetical protein